MLKKSLSILALAGLTALVACEKNDNDTINADTTVAPAAAPVATDTMAAPMTTDTGAMMADTGAMADTTAADTTM
jgi:hypothetical protein